MSSDINRVPAAAYAQGAVSVYGGDRTERELAHGDYSRVAGGVDWEDTPVVCLWPELTKKGDKCQAQPGVEDAEGYCIGHRRAADARARKRAEAEAPATQE